MILKLYIEDVLRVMEDLVKIRKKICLDSHKCAYIVILWIDYIDKLEILVVSHKVPISVKFEKVLYLWLWLLRLVQYKNIILLFLSYIELKE